MGIVSAQQESKWYIIMKSACLQKDWESSKKFTSRCELLTFIDLFPKRHRRVLPLIDIKWSSNEPVKEEKGHLMRKSGILIFYNIVGDIGECPTNFS